MSFALSDWCFFVLAVAAAQKERLRYETQGFPCELVEEAASAGGRAGRGAEGGLEQVPRVGAAGHPGQRERGEVREAGEEGGSVCKDKADDGRRTLVQGWAGNFACGGLVRGASVPSSLSMCRRIARAGALG